MNRNYSVYEWGCPLLNALFFTLKFDSFLQLYFSNQQKTLAKEQGIEDGGQSWGKAASCKLCLFFTYRIGYWEVHTHFQGGFFFGWREKVMWDNLSMGEGNFPFP